MTGRALVGVAAALFLAACSSTTNGTGARPGHPAARHDVAGGTVSTAPKIPEHHGPINPCELVTKAEVDHAAGTTTGAPVRSRDTCMYPTPTTAKFGQVNVYVGLGAKKIFDIDRKVLKHHFVSVSGIGDEAHLEEGEIFFRTNGVWVAVQLARLDNVAKGPLLEAMARAAVGRL
jgi:hypothetical protein